MAFEPTRPDDGARRHTTVASANGSRRSDNSTASVSTPRSTYSSAPWMAAHTLSGSTGMSMLRTPRWATASMTAFTNAAGEPTVADSPIPLAPIGWWGDGTHV